ncbi:hypothetical protein NUACC21_49580 [Scytonema sp. NUACC21]
MFDELNFQSNGMDRLPPQNIEAEEAILGGILLDPEAVSRVRDRLVPDAFYINAHKDIYQAALQLQSQGKPTDLLSVINWLNDHDILARVGGRNKLAMLVDRTVSAVNIDALADLVMEKYQRRQLIKAGNDIVQLGYQTETNLPIVLDQAEQKVFNVTQKRPQVGLVHISDTLINTFQDIETRHQGNALPGIPCGFYDLDAMTSGFQRSDLIIVAGRPSMGKTAFCLNLAHNIAASYRLPEILVVDDDADMRELAEFILTQAGAQVTTAASAAQALALLNQSVPNLLLCDIGMPEMDGYSLIRLLRKWSPQQGGTIPAIALTAYAGEINQQQALAAGFMMHISKPVEPEKLVQAIAQLLDSIGHSAKSIGDDVHISRE